MARRSDGLRTKQRILSACAQLFIQYGYHKTTMAQIFERAEVSASSFQNIFGTKDGVLMEFVQTLFESQFAFAHNSSEQELPPLYAYAAETSIQLAITDLNENIRECYLEAYSYEKTLNFIQHAMAPKLYETFGAYQPELTLEDFYVLDFGSAGIMRGYMANPATKQITTQMKARAFVSQVLLGYKVPAEEVQQVLVFVATLDLEGIARQVMDQLFQELALQYDFSLKNLSPKD